LEVQIDIAMPTASSWVPDAPRLDSPLTGFTAIAM
jgi:hypothetical protein